jgi:hypothetical protein
MSENNSETNETTSTTGAANKPAAITSTAAPTTATIEQTNAAGTGTGATLSAATGGVTGGTGGATGAESELDNEPYAFLGVTKSDIRAARKDATEAGGVSGISEATPDIIVARSIAGTTESSATANDPPPVEALTPEKSAELAGRRIPDTSPSTFPPVILPGHPDYEAESAKYVTPLAGTGPQPGNFVNGVLRDDRTVTGVDPEAAVRQEKAEAKAKAAAKSNK